MAFIGVIADGGMKPILTTAKAARSTLILLFHDLPTAQYIVKCSNNVKNEKTNVPISFWKRN